MGRPARLTRSKTMGLMEWWRPFKQEDVAFLKELIESGSAAPVIDRRGVMPGWRGLGT
jgi:hypothetical protein